MGNKIRQSVTARGILYAFLHFSVETACFYFLFFYGKREPYWGYLALLYDALAFVPQSLFGILTDKFPKLPVGVIGILMLLGALCIPSLLPALIVLAIGNALVHIAGAQSTLRGANGKIAPNAVFVAGGSFGVICGQLLAQNIQAGYMEAIPLVLLVISLFLSLLLLPVSGTPECVRGFHIAAPSLSDTEIILLSFFTVAVRSYIGYAIPTAWNQTKWQSILLFVCMGLGKALGGICSDRFGARKTALLSLLLALPLMACGDSVMIVSLLGVAFFSMTMPITLGVLISRFPDMPGLCFGITTIGLFVGSAPAFFFRPTALWQQILLVTVLTVLAVLCFSRSVIHKKHKTERV